MGGARDTVPRGIKAEAARVSRLSRHVVRSAYCVILSGCATVTIPDERQAPDLVLCAAMNASPGQVRSPSVPDRIETEVRRRELLTDTEWSAVFHGQIRTGMSLCGVYALLGQPARENHTVTSGVDHVQLVFPRYGFSARSIYVYTLNGKVRSWQY